MTRNELLCRLGDTIDSAKTALFATVDEKGAPRTRWVTPVLLRDRPGFVYFMTSPSFAKVKHIQANPAVQWTVQTPDLTAIISLYGTAATVEDPSLRAAVLEAVSPRLNVFWRAGAQLHDLVALETRIDRAVFWEPMRGIHTAVDFTGRKKR